MEINKICRFCLSKSHICFSLLDETYAVILESLTTLKVDKEDHLPKVVCVKCWLNVKLAHQIQQNILEAERKLKSLNFQNQTYKQEDKIETKSTPPINIKNESFDNEIKIEQEIIDIVDNGTIKVENLTNTELLVICRTDVNKENMTLKENEKTCICHICGTRIGEDTVLDHFKTHYLCRLQCDECNTYCENITSYRNHIFSNHKNMQNSWTCKVCFLTFQYKPLYKIHIEKAHSTNIKLTQKLLQNEKQHECPYCKKMFKTEQLFSSHVKTHLKKLCTICGVKISSSNFKVHVKSHTSSPEVCHLCGMVYKNYTSLRSHIHYTHSTRVYSCQYCNRQFKKAYDLPLHIKKEHTGEKNHVCDVCGKGFFTYHTLTKHIKMTHMKLRPFKCEFCKKQFSSKHALRTHERKHTNVTPYICEECGEGFRQNVSLRTHKKSAHNIVEDKACACKVCGKKFVNDWAVLSHMRVH